MTLPDWMAKDLGEDHAIVLETLRAAPGRLLFLETAQGNPRSAKAVGAWLGLKAQEAGLPAGRTPHGLRKSRLTSFAEMGWSIHQLMSWAGHLSPDEAILYTRRAERRRVLEGTERNPKAGMDREPHSRSREEP